MVSVIDRMTQDEFEVFVSQSMERMSRSIAKCNQEWDFPSYRQWSLKDDELTLFDGPSPPICCQFQIAGDYHTDRNFWRWSWCFLDFREKEIRDLALVKAFGHQHRITDIMLNGMRGASTELGWELAAVAANFLGSMSVYAAVERSRIWFLLIKSVRFASASDCFHGNAEVADYHHITGGRETLSRTSAGRSIPADKVGQPRGQSAKQTVGAAAVRKPPKPLRQPARSS